jgi:hypothetical protein
MQQSGLTMDEVAERQRLADTWAVPRGIIGWLSAAHHKTIATRFILTTFAFFLLGGLLAVLMRVQLAWPESTFLDPDLYNQIFSLHGTTMMFLFAVPVMEAMALYIVPLMLGTREIAFPRLAAFNYWVFLFGGAIRRAERCLGHQRLWLDRLGHPGPAHGTPFDRCRYRRAHGAHVHTARPRAALRRCQRERVLLVLRRAGVAADLCGDLLGSPAGLSATMEEHLASPPLTATGGATWTGVFGGPLAWFASQQVSYALVPWACHGGPPIAIHATNLVALAVVLFAGALAWRDLRRAGRQGSDERAPPEGRQRFLGLVGLMLCVLFGLAIVAQTIGVFFFDPCQR